MCRVNSQTHNRLSYRAILWYAFDIDEKKKIFCISFIISLFRDNRASKTADATFKWDADKDESKQVGVKATMARGKNIQGDVTLSMPALKKVW